MSKVEVNAQGIKNRLKSIKPYRSIAEYIWNGFDAGADTIDIVYDVSDLGNINSLSIEDNGNGIPFELLDNKFKPVLSSEKRESELQHTLIHGKNGLGRLTFYHFSHSIEWCTCYQQGEGYCEYAISTNDSGIDQYSSSEPINSKKTGTGTKVVFHNIYELTEQYMKDSVVGYLAKEFAWFLELMKDWGYAIRLNGEVLVYDSLIKDKESFEVRVESKTFTVNYIRWASKLNRHFSRYYCTDTAGNFKYSKPTTLNNKGDEFYHSAFVNDEYFDSFKSERNDGQVDLVSRNTDKSEVFKELVFGINSYLKNKRKPFIVDYAKSLIEEYEKKGIFPDYNAQNRWEVLRSEDIKETVKQLYQVDPRIFANLSTIQKKTFVSFISLIIDGGEVDDLFKVLDGVIELSSGERELFAKQLKTTKMSSIVQTIELISDRYKSVEEFKALVFDPSMYAGEVPHLQKMMERNYWLIGEEYQMLSAAEPKFEEALRRYTHILHGEKAKHSIEHPSKNREMDIFLVRQRKQNKKIENIVLELKHPVNIRLGKKEIDQVYDYYQVIRSEPRFNGSNTEWKFYLIGNKFDSTGYIDGQINSMSNHGEPGLVYRGEYKIYAFKWSEVFAEFELKHDFLNDKLNLELSRLEVDEHVSADDIVNNSRSSDSLPEYEAPAA